MDLYVLEQQIKNAEADLAEEVRLGELCPSPFVALRVERLYRTVAALKKRRNNALRNIRTNQPHTVPKGSTSYSNNDSIASLPENIWYRRSERWLAPRDSCGEGEWVWKGRAIGVTKNVLYDDSDLLHKLLKKAHELEEKLNSLYMSENNPQQTREKTELEKSWSEATQARVEAGEAIGEERIRVREKARQQLQARHDMLRKELLQNSAVNVQSVFRGHLGRKKMRDAREKYNLKIQHQGAEIIQSRFRGHMARQKIRRDKAKVDGETKQAAAMVLQSQFRGKLARQEFLNAKTTKGRAKAAASMIQAWYRGCVGRREVLLVRRRYREEIEEVAANMLQCAWRCRKARKLKDQLSAERTRAKEEAAAIMLQAAWRGKQARENVKGIRRELREVDEQLQSMQYADRVKVTFFAKKFLDSKQRAAVLIQAHARAFLQRKRFDKRKRDQRERNMNNRGLDQPRRPKLNKSTVVYDERVKVPLDWADGTQELASIRITVREIREPYQLRFEAVHQEAKFYRKIDVAVLEALLSPLFTDRENSIAASNKHRDKDMKHIMGWVLQGKNLRRKYLISWIVNRIWIEQPGLGQPLELRLGTASTIEGQELDNDLAAALPLSSPLAKSGSTTRGGRTRDNFVVRYAD